MKRLAVFLLFLFSIQFSYSQLFDTLKDARDGRNYLIVQIGTKWWMAENLQAKKLTDGTPIPILTDSLAWLMNSQPAYCWYFNDSLNQLIYGSLYNWYAVNTEKLCPTGWKVPSDDDWKELEISLGMAQADAEDIDFRGTDEGNKLKESGTYHWESPNLNANNSSGFSALPGGIQWSGGGFFGLGEVGNYWTSTTSTGDKAWYRSLHYDSPEVFRSERDYNNAHSIRCVSQPDLIPPEICVVTNDADSGHNLIVWDNPADIQIVLINIYRESQVIAEYDLIASIPATDLSVYVDREIDTESNPFRYKISALDTMGDESDLSSSHQPLFLQHSGSIGGVNLAWTDYEIEGTELNFTTIEIYRGDNWHSMEKIADVPGAVTTYTDNSAEATTTRQYYRIAGVLSNPCTPSSAKKANTGPFSHTFSNLIDNGTIIGDTTLADPEGLLAFQCNEQVYLLLTGYPTRRLKQFNIYRGQTSPASSLHSSLMAPDYNDTLLIDPVNYGESWFYRVTAVDSSDQETGFSNEVMILSKKAVDLGKDSTLCGNDGLRLDAGEGFPMYQWSVQDSADRYLTVKTPGTYWVNVTNDNGCISSDTIIINHDNSSDLDLGPDRRICSGEEIVLRAGKGFQSYLWNDGSGSDTLVVTEPGLYSVSASSAGNCGGYDEILLSLQEIYQEQEICMVTVNSENRIIVVWEKPVGKGIKHFNIYREQSRDNYQKIGAVPFNDLSIYVDESSVPDEYAHLYKISVTDSCDQESELSAHHKSIHLQTNVGLSAEVNLNWDEYQGFNYVDYEIYRGASPASLFSVRSISASVRSWTDTQPVAGSNYYRIMVVKPTPCYPSGLKSDEYAAPFSNLDDENIVGMNPGSVREFRIYPNPFTEVLYVQFPNQSHYPYRLRLLDLAGKVLMHRDNITGEVIQLNREGLSNGIYLLELSGAEIYRSTLIIE